MKELVKERVEELELALDEKSSIMIMFSPSTETVALRSRIFVAHHIFDQKYFHVPASEMPAVPSPHDRIAIINEPDDIDTLFYNHGPSGTTVFLGPDSMQNWAQRMKERNVETGERAVMHVRGEGDIRIPLSVIDTISSFSVLHVDPLGEDPGFDIDIKEG